MLHGLSYWQCQQNTFVLSWYKSRKYTEFAMKHNVTHTTKQKYPSSLTIVITVQWCTMHARSIQKPVDSALSRPSRPLSSQALMHIEICIRVWSGHRLASSFVPQCGINESTSPIVNLAYWSTKLQFLPINTMKCCWPTFVMNECYE
jgi:hypothetical protein